MISLCPITISDAKVFCEQHHRDHDPPVSALWAVAIARGDDVVGAAIVGRPVARALQDGWTCEVTRVTVLEGVKNGCSMLYGASWRAARALGYRRAITYTGKDEPGTSLRAAGWKVVGEVRAKSWHTPSRPRVDRNPQQAKLRWEASA